MKRSTSILTKSLIFTFLLSSGFTFGKPTRSEGIPHWLQHTLCTTDPICHGIIELRHYGNSNNAAKRNANVAAAQATAAQAAAEAQREAAKKEELRKQHERQLKRAEGEQRKKVVEQKRRYNRTQIRPGYANRPVYKGSVSKPLAGKTFSSRILSNSARRVLPRGR